MKTVRIIISLVLIICLISSFYAPAYAITPEVTAIGGGLAGIIALLFGIKYTSDLQPNQFAGVFNTYAPQDPDLLSFVADVITNPVGTTTLFINKAFFDYLKQINGNVITEEGLQDWEHGQMGNYGEVFGVPIVSCTDSSTYYVLRTNNYVIPNPIGQVSYIYSAPGYKIVTPQYPAGWSNYNSGRTWYIQTRINKSDLSKYSVFQINSAGSFTISDEYVNVSITEQNITYDTEEIDTTPGTDLPSEGGAAITIPEVGFQDVAALITRIIQLFLQGELDEDDIQLVDEEPAPYEGDTIAETPWYDLVGLFNNIGNKITDGFNDLIGLFENVGETISEGFIDVIGLFEDVGETITDIYDTVVEKVGSIELSLDSILEAVQSLVQSIETAAVDLFSDFLSAIQSIFAPILGRIRSSLGIWHYVVEWLNCIGGVFTWIFGLCSGTAYCMVVPIYASIAAAICIALYKRFGR